MAETASIKTQVVIAGAGPTGLSLAAQLLRYNIDFVLFDKNAATTPLSKAVVVQARTLEIFQELGIAGEAIKRGRITTALRMFYKGRQKMAFELRRLGEGLSPFPFALSLEQSKTETLLVEYLAQHNQHVRWQSELQHFEQNGDGVRVLYKDVAGAQQTIEAAFLVGCDGASSAVRHGLQLPFEGTTEPKLFYVADVLLRSTVINQDALYMYLIEKGFVLFFPMEGAGHYRIVGIVPSAGTDDRNYTFADIEPVIKKSIVSPVQIEELRWFSTYKVHSRKAAAFQQGRCFIAGDAAHIHTPAGGQGMNTGIQDAYNLAWKLAFTLRGQVQPQVLQSYSAEREENARHLLNTTDRMFDIMSGSNGFWNFFRLRLFPSFLQLVSKSRVAQRRLFPLLSQTGIAYPHSTLTVTSSIGNVNAGDRMPHILFANGTTLFDQLTAPTFKLLYFGTESAMPTISNTSIPISFHAFNEIPKQWFGAATDFYILLRPDNHISYIGNNLSACEAFLQTISVR